MCCTKSDVAADGHAFPTLWGTPWDVSSGYRRKNLRFHALAATLVLTLPKVIAAIALQNPAAVVYGIPFRATAETLRTIAVDPEHLVSCLRNAFT